MLKGHVQIDLHNHNSGFTERYEQDNLVTNAISKILPNYLYWGGIGGGKYQPLATTLLGGVMLFDDSLTESADNIFFPSNAHLMGFGGQYVNTANPMSGSINSIESGPTATGYTSVWDFTTSQCNGTIASLARTLWTTNIADVFRNDSAVSSSGNFFKEFTINGSEEVYPIHYADRYLYLLRGTTVIRIYIPSAPFKVSDALYVEGRGNPETVKTITIPSLYRSMRNWVFNHNDDGYSYYLQAQGNGSGDGHAKYFTIKLSDLSFDVSAVTDLTLPSCKLYGSNPYSHYGFERIINGKAYIPSSDLKSVYIQDLSNPNNIIKADFPSGFWIYNGSANFESETKKSGVYSCVITNGSSNYRTLVYPDGTVVKDYWSHNTAHANYRSCIHISDLFNIHHTGSGYTSSRIFSYDISPDYLGTICNLASPVTKTANQSMKITYTLTDAQEQ